MEVCLDLRFHVFYPISSETSRKETDYGMKMEANLLSLQQVLLALTFCSSMIKKKKLQQQTMLLVCV